MWAVVFAETSSDGETVGSGISSSTDKDNAGGSIICCCSTSGSSIVEVDGVIGGVGCMSAGRVGDGTGDG